MFSIVKVARDQTQPGSLRTLPRDGKKREPWTRLRGKFCYVIKIFCVSPEILEIVTLFSSLYRLTPRSANAILVRAEAIKSFAIYLTC